ncbi:hypothetical protein SBF1_170008 [Candidatus Desulfosporosinus infrequens]|uniref:Uncharacterized protein n=1 Tax=Candidatus Desulfosporosinus infrequens TaxID=2043169 RepID=A0A2U3KBE8_9FIRM|nr:hypothetical protein SBF1_170008 [Candidatus Desulfosporosinus infrequens]
MRAIFSAGLRGEGVYESVGTSADKKGFTDIGYWDSYPKHHWLPASSQSL